MLRSQTEQETDSWASATAGPVLKLKALPLAWHDGQVVIAESNCLLQDKHLRISSHIREEAVQGGLLA